MITYHKIYNIFHRNMETKKLIPGDWARPEFELLQDINWTFTEKVDGTNIRVLWGSGNESPTCDFTLWFAGKTDKAQLPGRLVQHLNQKFSTEAMLDLFGTEQQVCLYGEGYGAGIQSGGYYSHEQKFVLFDVLVGRVWKDRGFVEHVGMSLGIEVIPIVKTCSLNDAVELVSSKNLKSTWGNFVPEGVVGRPTCELRDQYGERIIVKVKTHDF